LCLRKARASDPPIRPVPMIVICRMGTVIHRRVVGYFDFFLKSLAASTLSKTAAALILATCTISSPMPESVEQGQFGLAPQRGQ
jgi:hypothetical protein